MIFSMVFTHWLTTVGCSYVFLQGRQIFSVHEMKTPHCWCESFQQQPGEGQPTCVTFSPSQMHEGNVIGGGWSKQTIWIPTCRSVLNAVRSHRASFEQVKTQTHLPPSLTSLMHKKNGRRACVCVCVKLNNQQRECVGERVESVSFSRSESLLHLLLSVCNVWKCLSVCNVWKCLLWL